MSIRISELDLSAISLDLEKDIAWEELSKTTFEISEKESFAEKEISLSICDEEEIQSLNKQYRNKDSVTDVLSFAAASSPDLDLPILGDVIICLKRAIEQAEMQGHSLKRELSFLYVHGLLHLLGYDHIKKEEETIMFPLQDKILNKLDIVN